MQVGQPIWFDFGGVKVYGIVQEVLPEKKGVMAITQVNGKNIKMEIPEPHKVRDLEEANKIRQAFGLPLIGQAPAPVPPPPPKEIVPIDPETMFNDDDIKWLKGLQEFGKFIQPNSKKPTENPPEPAK